MVQLALMTSYSYPMMEGSRLKSPFSNAGEKYCEQGLGTSPTQWGARIGTGGDGNLRSTKDSRKGSIPDNNRA